jgi:hypothetical protein
MNELEIKEVIIENNDVEYIVNIHKFNAIEAITLRSKINKDLKIKEKLVVLITKLLDAFKDIKRIPDCSVAQALRRLSTILREFSKQQIESVIKFALVYPPRVRALVGAILQNNGHTDKGLEKLKNSLNPFTIINLGLKETELTTKIDWHIK